MRFCSSAILVSLTSSGACGGAAARRRFGRRLRLLASGQPHDRDHEKGQPDEKPGLDVFRQKTLRFRRFFLNLSGLVRLSHLAPQFPAVRRANGSFFLPMAR